MVFERHPNAGPSAEEFHLEVGGVSLSGLLAKPAGGEPRALIVAVHGASMHAGYFDARSAPGLSLLELASEAGYAVWAPDRPGVATSADLPEDRLALTEQADLLLQAVDGYALREPMGRGALLVGHSFGAKLAWAMAARDTENRFLGVDTYGTGVSYSPAWTASIAEQGPGPVRRNSEDMWGPSDLYPPQALRRSALPTHEPAGVLRQEKDLWPAYIRSVADRIHLPMRISFGAHERIWPTDENHLDELRDVFVKASYVGVEIEPYAGHNISLGWAARSYHLKVLAFLEGCCLARQLT